MIARKHPAFAIAASLFMLVQGQARADYISQPFALNSQYAGANAGNVVAEANDGSSALNGLLPGQVRLTFNVNAVPAYTKVGTDIGIVNAEFFTNLPLASSQVSIPAGWTASRSGGPGANGMDTTPPNVYDWQAYGQSLTDHPNPLTLVISGLGSQATLAHFTTPIQVWLPNPEFGEPPPIIFDATVGFPGPAGPNNVPVWFDSVSTASVAPEPSAFALAAIGLVGIVVARRRRVKR